MANQDLHTNIGHSKITHKNPIDKIIRTVKVKRIAFLFAVIFAMMLIVTSFAGCWMVAIPPTELRFNPDSSFIREAGDIDSTRLEIFMRLEETIRITADDIIVIPVGTTQRNFNLRSYCDDIISISPTREVRAVEVGMTYLYATSTVASHVYTRILVIVDYLIPENIRLITNDNLVQYKGVENSVTFRIEFEATGYLPQNATARWFVNNELIETAGCAYSDYFNFLPWEFERPNLFEIRAVVEFAGGYQLYATEIVRIFLPFDIYYFDYDYTLMAQELEPFIEVLFIAYYQQITGNLTPIFEWRVNGELQKTSIIPNRFAFTPTVPNVYDITLTINGRVVYTYSGNTYARLIARGVLAPQNVSFDFSGYPNLILSWNDILDYNIRYAVRITKECGTIIIDEFTNFYGNTLDISNFIGYYLPYNIFNTNFDIYVRSLGGDNFLPSEFEAPLQLEQIPLVARPYLLRTLAGGHRNYFASTIEDLAEIFNFRRIFRMSQFVVAGQPIPQDTIRVFIGFEFSGSAQDMITYALELFDVAGTREFSFSLSGARQHLNIIISYLTDGLPSGATTNPSINARSNTVIPHIHFGAPRNEYYEFAADRLEKSIVVTTSEQLWTVLEKGFLPLPAYGSDAYRIWYNARDILRHIIDYDFSEFEKILAIYSYLLFAVRFDHTAGNSNLAAYEAVRLNAFYLEGVFDDGIAVCDGMAKAFSLLANIEGIVAIRVGGYNIAAGGIPHAWNRVSLDGEWYNVDIAKGNLVTSLPSGIGLGVVPREVATHEFFLKTCLELASTHRVRVPNRYPQTSETAIDVYERIAYVTGGVSLHLSNRHDSRLEAARLVDYMLSRMPIANCANDENYVFYAGEQIDDNRVSTQFISFTILIHPDLVFSYFGQNTPLHAAFALAGLRTTYTGGNDFFIVSHRNVATGINQRIVFIRVA